MLTAERLRQALAQMSSPSGGERSIPLTALNPDPLHSPRTTSSKEQHKPSMGAPDVSWTEYYPFPTFAKKGMEQPPSDMDSDDADETRRPILLTPHPLSSDAVLNASAPLRATSNSTVSSSPVTPQHEAKGNSSSVRDKGFVTKEEITALISIFDVGNPLAGRIELAHMDLQWLVRKKRAKTLTPPAVHLHLGNIAPSLLTAAKDQILINSPRSAVVLLRNGVTVLDLKKQHETLSTAVVEKKPFVTLEQLTWEQKKYLALETARLAKLREVVEEYKEVCKNVSFDDVVSFCSAYRPEQPSSALLLPFAGVHDKGRTRRSAEAQCGERFASLVEKFEHREQRINRSTEILAESMESERRRIVERLVRAEERAQSAMAARAEHVRNQGIASRGRSELWRAQRQRHDRVENFQRMVTREGVQRRLDEVACVQAGMKNTIANFQDRVRRKNFLEAIERERTHSSFLKRAKQMFLETQK